MSGKKIFLTGAQGTGKSTLNSIIVRKTGLHQIDSISEKFFPDKTIFKDLYSKEYYDAQLKILAYALDKYVNGGGFVSSRCFADAWAYLSYSFHITGNDKFADLFKIVETYQELIKHYTHIYIPPEFALSDENELRSTNEEFQKDIDERIKIFLKLTETKHHIVSGTIEERTEQVEEILKTIPND